ncbi:MAG: hypothetical protein PHG82_03410 [Candidatus Gracilibacteria bacterium]|nr:hypothetical protein [Candidatus Gracilibacteria bacterium]
MAGKKDVMDKPMIDSLGRKVMVSLVPTRPDSASIYINGTPTALHIKNVSREIFSDASENVSRLSLEKYVKMFV